MVFQKNIGKFQNAPITADKVKKVSRLGAKRLSIKNYIYCTSTSAGKFQNFRQNFNSKFASKIQFQDQKEQYHLPVIVVSKIIHYRLAINGKYSISKV